MTMITPSYLGETIEYSSLHACRSTLEDPTKVEIFDDKGAPHTVWSGNDPTKELNYFPVKFDKTTYKTDRVKVTLATNVVPGWNEIDAVQLVGKEN